MTPGAFVVRWVDLAVVAILILTTLVSLGVRVSSTSTSTRPAEIHLDTSPEAPIVGQQPGALPGSGH